MVDSFLHQTAHAIIDTIDWQQLSRTTFVLPSHRAGLVLKDELLRLQQQRQAKAIWAPTVRTLPQLQDAISPLYAEDELFTIVRLYKIYRSTLNIQPSTDPMPLDKFYGWGRQMLADFTNIDVSMSAEEVPNFFENTIAAHELEQWNLAPEVEERLRQLMSPVSDNRSSVSDDSIRRQYEHLWQQLYVLYCGLQAEMAAENKGYPGMRQRAVITHWNEPSVQNQIAGRTFVFVGFNYLLPVERELMIRLRDAGQALFFWDYIADFETNTKAFSFAQFNSGILGSVLPARRWENPRDVTVMACVSKEAQAQYVHRWLQQNYTQQGQKIGVVICDETMLEPVIYALPALTLPGKDEPEPINITKGFPLRNTAVYARTLKWLSDKARGNANDVVSPDIIEQLLADLFPVATEEENLSPVTENQSSMSWQELLILESEYQVRKIANQLHLLLTNGINDVPFTLKLLRLLMRRMMENITLPFHGEPVTDIQVMGVLETRLLDFDKLLLLNVEEGVLPQKQTDLSFIPFYLRKAYHMQTPEERATVYAYNFFRLLSRAGHATLLYATAETAEGGKGMSRFIMQMLYSPEFKVSKTCLQEQSVLTNAAYEIDTATPAQITRLSPSALNTFITCPRSFYLQYVLGLRPKEDEKVLFNPNTMGSFVHHVIEYLYRTYLHCDNSHPVRVTPDEIEAIRTNKDYQEAALDAAYQAMNERWLKDHPGEENHYIAEHHRGENVIIKGYVNNILEYDREGAKVGLQLYRLEKRMSFTLKIDGIGEIEVGGTVDRLDIYGAEGNECLRVVDYKSGGYNDTTHAKKMTSSWEDLMTKEEKGYVRQTLIYSHAVKVNDRTGLPVEPHLFFCRRRLADIQTTIEVENNTVHDYAAIAPDFLAALQQKIEQLLKATDYPQCEPDKCPTFCPFFSLCGRKPAQTY